MDGRGKLMASSPWWVGGYIEAGMSASGSSGTPYFPFVFQAANHAQAVANDGAKLLAGPFSTQQAAQDWATAYEKNPATLHAGSSLPKSPGNPVPGSNGNNGAGTVTGDTPPAPVSGLAAIGQFFTNLGSANLWIRVAKVVIGGALLIIGLAHMTGSDHAIARTARMVPLPI